MRNKVVLVKNSFVLDESLWQSLHSKGFGEKKGEDFSLNVLEVLFLLKKGKISVFDLKDEEIGFDFILKRFKVDFNEFLVFCDLVKKGYNVQSGLRYGVDFRVYDKGLSKGEAHSDWLVRVSSFGDKFKVSDFASFNRVAHSTKKKLVFAVVDLENDVTYFESSWTKMN